MDHFFTPGIILYISGARYNFIFWSFYLGSDFNCSLPYFKSLFDSFDCFEFVSEYHILRKYSEPSQTSKIGGWMTFSRQNNLSHGKTVSIGHTSFIYQILLIFVPAKLKQKVGTSISIISK